MSPRWPDGPRPPTVALAGCRRVSRRRTSTGCARHTTPGRSGRGTLARRRSATAAPPVGEGHAGRGVHGLVAAAVRSSGSGRRRLHGRRYTDAAKFRAVLFERCAPGQPVLDALHRAEVEWRACLAAGTGGVSSSPKATRSSRQTGATSWVLGSRAGLLQRIAATQASRGFPNSPISFSIGTTVKDHGQCMTTTSSRN